MTYEYMKKVCRHDEVYFGSGDYYLICRECGRKWALMGDEREYELDPKTGKTLIGADPSFCTQGFTDTGSPRVRPNEVTAIHLPPPEWEF